MTEEKRILRQPEVSELTGLPRSTLYLRIKQGKFAAPIRLGPRAVGWLREDVDRFIDDRINDSRAA